jgi:hypothetical protein
MKFTSDIRNVAGKDMVVVDALARPAAAGAGQQPDSVPGGNVTRATINST